MTYPLAWIRQQFPALAESPTVFLDNAAGSQVPHHVVDAVQHALVRLNVNRGAAYGPSQEVTALVEEVRALVAECIVAARPENIIFGANATTLLELLSANVRRVLSPGDEVIVTALDHHANIDPWRRLEEIGVNVKVWWPKGSEVRLELSDLDALLSLKTRIVAMTAASNALGTLTEVRAVADKVHAVGGFLMVDAVHYSAHILPDVDAMGADMLVFSPYKFFAPHLGVLYLRDPLLALLPNQALSFLPSGTPKAWEPGTLNHACIAGLGAVFDYLDEVAQQLAISTMGCEAWNAAFGAFAAHEQTLTKQLLGGLATLGAELYGLKGAEGRTATVSFNLPGHTPQAVAAHLAAQGVAVACGHYYAYTLMMEVLGLQERGGAVRVSALHYTSPDDIAQLLEALAQLSTVA